MLYYGYGTALLTAEEARDSGAAKEVRELSEAVAGGRRARTIELPNGVVSPEMVSTDLESIEANRTPWEPIGLGKPLTIDIREVYTGKHPTGWFWQRPGMLITSAVKGTGVYEAKPLAVNFLTGQVEKHSRLSRPAASQEGTPVIHHSPAMVDRSLTLDVTVVFDEFPQDLLTKVSSAFKAAAGLPLFLTYSGYLLAAGEIARIAGVIGEKLLDHTPVVQASEPIDLALPGATRREAGFFLVTPSDVDSLDPTFRRMHDVSTGTLLNTETGQPYSGDIPYVVLATDGTERRDLANFAPSAATAAVLSRFLGLGEGQGVTLDPLLDALRLYNDFTFRTEYDKLEKEIASTSEADRKAALEQRLQAVKANIGSDLLKPK